MMIRDALAEVGIKAEFAKRKAGRANGQKTKKAPVARARQQHPKQDRTRNPTRERQFSRQRH